MKNPFKKDKPIEEEYRKYFKGHDCHLPDRHNHGHKYGKFRNLIHDLTTVRFSDIRARNLFTSYSALCSEKRRQYKHYSVSIHPFSKLRLWCDAYTSIVLILSSTLLPICYSAPVPLSKSYHIFLMSMFDNLYFVSILVNFFSGYVDGKTTRYVVLSLRKIWFRYATTWLVIDFLIAFCFLPTLLTRDAQILPHTILATMKLLRLPSLLGYLNNVMVVTCNGIIRRSLLEITVLMYFYIMWNIYYQFAVEYIIDGSYDPPANPRKCSWMTIGNIWNATAETRFLYAVERSVGMLRKNANIYSMLETNDCYESFIGVSWLIAKFLVYHCVLKYIVAKCGSESAKSSYYLMTKQVESYMDSRKYPTRIKQKILKFYLIRYQFHYYSEAQMLACLPYQLKEDILMHTGRKIVRELRILKHLPRSLTVEIGLKLRFVIFMAGDIIIKINTVGDCMYVIDKGTVAIYTESGNEICHLEDGDFFGEIALVTKGLRTASAVAVSNCELFRLDKEDFDNSVSCYPTVYNTIKKLASSRYERTIVLDEP